MDNILPIIDYLFSERNVINSDNSLNSFFDNGVSFPLLVAISFNLDQIPNVNSKPKTLFTKKKNNDIALKYLLQNNHEIAKLSPKFKSEQDKLNLLILILTKQCFTLDHQEILTKCNLIASPYKIYFSSVNELVHPEYLLALLNVLTDGKSKTGNEIKSIDQSIIIAFNKANVPLVTNPSLLQGEYQFTFFIQIEIIFRIYSSKINHLIQPKKKDDQIQQKFNEKPKDDQNQQKPKEQSKDDQIQQKFNEKSKDDQNQQNSKEKSNDDQIEQKFNDKPRDDHNQHKSKDYQVQQKSKDDQIQYKSKEEAKDDQEQSEPRISLIDEDEINYYSDSEEENEIEKNQNKKSIENLNDISILRTINSIVKDEHYHLNNLYQTIEKDNLPKFVSLFLKNDQRLNQIIEQKKNSIEKVYDVIKYLGEINPIFEVLQFNFKEQKFVKTSIILFYTTFLNLFFINPSKKELFERCTTILFGNVQKEDYFFSFYQKIKEENKNPFEDKKILFNWNTYLALVNYANIKKTHYKDNKNKDDEFYFNQKNIPQIIDEKHVKYVTKEIPDVFYYQLQFIFNTIDNEKYKFFLHECVLLVIKKLRNIKVPKYDTLASNIRAKNVALILQKQRNQIINQTDQKNSTSKIENNSGINGNNRELRLQKYFNENQLNDFNFNEYYENIIHNYLTSVNLETFEISYENGIICSNETTNQFKQEWINNMLKFQMKTSDPNSSNIDKEWTELVLFKIFYYDELNKSWEIDQKNLSFFHKYIMKNNTNVKTPIILFFNSNEEDLTLITSVLIKHFYPDTNIDLMYVYAICDRYLYEYNSTVEIDDKQIKPIILLLHVPWHKRNNENLISVVYKIYFFLTSICDIGVVILNKDYYIDQLSILEKLDLIELIYKTNHEQKTKKNEIIIGNDNDDEFSSDGDEDFEQEKEEIINYNLNDILDKIDSKYLNNEPKFIFLLNDKTIQENISQENDEFIENIKKRIHKKCYKVHYINVDNSNTYENFLNTLTNFALDINSDFDKLKLIDLSHIDDICISYISGAFNYDTKGFIYSRLNPIIRLNIEKRRPLTPIYYLYKGFHIFGSFLKPSFLNECMKHIDFIKKTIISNYDEYVQQLLLSSSKGNLHHISEFVNCSCYISRDIKDALKNNHVQFLRREFMEIIQSMFPERNDYFIAFQKYQTILEEQIRIDRKLMKKILPILKNEFHQ